VTEIKRKRYVIWKDLGCYEGWHLIAEDDDLTKALKLAKENGFQDYYGEVMVTKVVELEISEKEGDS